MEENKFSILFKILKEAGITSSTGKSGEELGREFLDLMEEEKELYRKRNEETDFLHRKINYEIGLETLKSLKEKLNKNYSDLEKFLEDYKDNQL